MPSRPIWHDSGVHGPDASHAAYGLTAITLYTCETSQMCMREYPHDMLAAAHDFGRGEVCRSCEFGTDQRCSHSGTCSLAQELYRHIKVAQIGECASVLHAILIQTSLYLFPCSHHALQRRPMTVLHLLLTCILSQYKANYCHVKQNGTMKQCMLPCLHTTG